MSFCGTNCCMWHHQETDPETSSNSRRSRLATTREVCWTFHCSLQNVIDSCTCLVKIWRQKLCILLTFDALCSFFVYSLSYFFYTHTHTKPPVTSNQHGQCHSFGQLATSNEGDVERSPKSKFYHVLPVVAKRKGMKDSNISVPLRQGLQAAGECQGPQTKIETPKALKNLGQLLSTTLPTLQYTLILPSTKHHALSNCPGMYVEHGWNMFLQFLILTCTGHKPHPRGWQLAPEKQWQLGT